MIIFIFFHIRKKKALDSRKFSTSGFRRIYMLWDIFNTIWPFLENVCLCVCMSPKFCGHCISRTNARKLMKLYIQLRFVFLWKAQLATPRVKKKISECYRAKRNKTVCDNIFMSRCFFHKLEKNFNIKKIT